MRRHVLLTALALGLSPAHAADMTGMAMPAASGKSASGKSAASTAAPGAGAKVGHAAANKKLNIYQDAMSGLSPAVRGVPQRVYVPNGKDNTVSVIDAKTFKVLWTFPVDKEPQHVVPGWDLKTLWVASDEGRQSLTPIDPRSGKPGTPVPVDDPYNLYFTPDGKYALVVAEMEKRLDFMDPHTMKKQFSIPVPCRGVNHMDFSVDHSFVIAGCEFSGDMIKVDLVKRQVVKKLHIGGMPQDVKLSPDGTVFYAADMVANGIYLLDGDLNQIGFIPTGKGAHGLYPSRDATKLYISNRGEGSVSVLDFATRKLIAKWVIPGGGSPDMGGVSADGKQLWLSGRYSDEVYVFDTRSGQVIRKIKVGQGPHGLCFFPQPGRYSLGHTGVYR